MKPHLNQKNVNNTNSKTLWEMFIWAPYKPQVGVLKTSFGVPDHPQKTSKHKYGLSPGNVALQAATKPSYIQVSALLQWWSIK